MKALTIIQPWASLIAIGAKRFETRSWKTNYRGQLAIHAGKKKPSDVLNGVDVDVIFSMGRAFGIEPHIRKIIQFLDTLPRGAMVATGNLARCDAMWDGQEVGLLGAVCINRENQYWSPNWQTITDEFLFGDWRPGRFAWEMEKVKQLTVPVPAKGMQGIWNWEECI
jgi:hypothetical protein